MTDSEIDRTLPAPAVQQHPARARFRLVWGKASIEADAHITPAGLLAIGGMVGVILLAVAPIVRAAGEARARR
ncbi:hypothetical protein [Devosia beringensis]|uniref:hypothetical protein n=1 Tax=Devosia beringensis TaxID=2657486 RepID=UPI00186B7CBA|nr:hypothetical protein [Devosia beringensis]